MFCMKGETHVRNKDSKRANILKTHTPSPPRFAPSQAGGREAALVPHRTARGRGDGCGSEQPSSPKSGLPSSPESCPLSSPEKDLPSSWERSLPSSPESGLLGPAPSEEFCCYVRMWTSCGAFLGAESTAGTSRWNSSDSQRWPGLWRE